jgi:hypothetical protein
MLVRVNRAIPEERGEYIPGTGLHSEHTVDSNRQDNRHQLQQNDPYFTPAQYFADQVYNTYSSFAQAFDQIAPGTRGPAWYQTTRGKELYDHILNTRQLVFDRANNYLKAQAVQEQQQDIPQRWSPPYIPSKPKTAPVKDSTYYIPTYSRNWNMVRFMSIPKRGKPFEETARGKALLNTIANSSYHNPDLRRIVGYGGTTRRGYNGYNSMYAPRYYVYPPLTENKVAESQPTFATSIEIPFALGNDGLLYLINGIAQGAGNNQRVGRRVRIKSIQVNYRISKKGADTNNTVALKTWIIVDHQSNGTAFTLADFLLEKDISSTRNQKKLPRFQTLYSQVEYFDLRANPGGYSVKAREIYKKCNINVNFIATDPFIASIGTNSIWWVTLQEPHTAACLEYEKLYLTAKFTDA